MLPFISYNGFWSDQVESFKIELFSILSMKRNIETLPFRTQMGDAERNLLFSLCRDRIVPLADFSSTGAEIRSRTLFAEQALCSETEQHFDMILTERTPTAVAVNGSSHLSLHHAFSDGKFYSAFNELDNLDDRIGETVEYAFRDRFGFLFENPADCGTGFSARTLLHLPALSISNARDEAKSICSEFETEIAPYLRKDSLPLYVLSAKNSFSDSEQDICANMQGATAALERFEKEARESHKSLRLPQLEDLVWRSFGLLSNCRMISWDEGAEYLLNLRLGIALEIFPHFSTAELNTLIFETSDPFLSLFSDDEKNDYTTLRADLIRRAMNKR